MQVLLVDLRCHGESAGLPNRPEPPHSVQGAAKDVLMVRGRATQPRATLTSSRTLAQLLRDMKLFPHVLIGPFPPLLLVASVVGQPP